MTGDFFFVAAVAGLLSFLTPCVFPMLPVTLAYFGGREGEGSRGGARAGWFAAGIVVSFTLLGLITSSVVGASGVNRFASDPRVNLLLAALFIVFAANLFGLFEIKIPSTLLTKATTSTSATSARSAGGAALLGAVFSLTSLTCTAPFVGTLLVLAARGERAMPLTGMLVFSAAFALPFYILARAPRLLDRLPRAGSWIQTLRICVGVIELAAAVKFISNADIVSNWGVVTRGVVIVIWAAMSVALTLYLISRAFTDRSSRFLNLAGGAMFGVVAFALVSAGRGKNVALLEPYLPPVREAMNASGIVGERWILNDYPRALAEASASDKMVIIDFTGYTCTNCRWMEANVFNRPDVRAELGKFVQARLYTDGEGQPFEAQQALQEKQFGTVALPLYAIVEQTGKTRATLSGITRDPADFLKFLRSAR